MIYTYVGKTPPLKSKIEGLFFGDLIKTLALLVQGFWGIFLFYLI